VVILQVFHKLLRDKMLKELGKYTQIRNRTVRLYMPTLFTMGIS